MHVCRQDISHDCSSGTLPVLVHWLCSVSLYSCPYLFFLLFSLLPAFIIMTGVREENPPNGEVAKGMWPV